MKVHGLKNYPMHPHNSREFDKVHGVHGLNSIKGNFYTYTPVRLNGFYPVYPMHFMSFSSVKGVHGVSEKNRFSMQKGETENVC